jgi:hypothetical protein
MQCHLLPAELYFSNLVFLLLLSPNAFATQVTLPRDESFMTAPMDEKFQIQETTTSTAPPTNPRSGLDVAFKYIQDMNAGNFDFEHVNLQALRRKIDWRIVPIMFLCYTMQFLDKVNINVSNLKTSESSVHSTYVLQYANVMGLSKDLNLVNNDFSNTSTAFFIAYLIAEVPNGKSPKFVGSA